jgi:3-ketosteroid 9alpha-monooxygenase subunit A
MTSTVEEVDRLPDDGFPYQGISPRGWFQVAWAKEIGPGELKPLRYFSTDMVLFRDMDGIAHVVEAHCPHLGAHIGYGGTVSGNCIVCPFHGWQWNSDGTHHSTPDTDRTHKGHRLRVWPVREFYDLIMVWHHPDGEAPSWELPDIPEYGDPSRYEPWPELTHHWHNIVARPQYPGENSVDAPHQQWVHKSPSKSTLLSWEIDGPIFRSWQSFLVGAGREKTWLTPNGPVEGRLAAESWGVGISFARYKDTDESVHIHCHTPIDERHMDERLTVLAEREDPSDPEAGPGQRTLRRFKFEKYQFERDVEVWKHMRYVERPPYAPDEARPYFAYRNWLRQFYGDERED